MNIPSREKRYFCEIHEVIIFCYFSSSLPPSTDDAVSDGGRKGGVVGVGDGEEELVVLEQ